MTKSCVAGTSWFRGPVKNALLALFALLTVGCSDVPRDGPRVSTIPVTGQVLVGGHPAAQVAVRAEPMNGPTPTYTSPSAITDAEGRFALKTYESGDGVPIGDYRLTFQWGQINLMSGRYSGDRFRGKYSKATESPHRIRVTPSSEPIHLGTVELAAD